MLRVVLEEENYTSVLTLENGVEVVSVFLFRHVIFAFASDLSHQGP